MKFCRKICFFLLIGCTMFFTLGFKSSNQVPIDARKNALFHNNMGITYLKEGNVQAAITSFKIAVALNPKTEASSVIYDNLGSAYMKVNSYKLAEDCYLAAIKFSPMNFNYYQNLVWAYKEQGVLEEKLYQADKVGNGMNDVLNALILRELGEREFSDEILESFIKKEKDLIITPAIKEFYERNKNSL